MNLSEGYKNRLQELANISEVKKKSDKLDAGNEIHLPELTMKKKDLIKFLKDVYGLKIEE